MISLYLAARARCLGFLAGVATVSRPRSIARIAAKYRGVSQLERGRYRPIRGEAPDRVAGADGDGPGALYGVAPWRHRDLGTATCPGRNHYCAPAEDYRTTGTTLHIPVHLALAEILAKTPTKHLTFLITEAGTRFRPPSLSWRFRTWCDEAGLPHCTAHGRRKAQCRRLAEAGCSVHEIAAISGHLSG